LSGFALDNRIGAIIIAMLLTTVVVMVVGFAYLQNEINSLKPQAPNPTASPTNTAVFTPEPIPTTTAETPTPYAYVVYEWYLQPEIMGNITWLDNAMNDDYNSSRSWKQNYIDYIASIWEIPQGMKDSGMSGLAGAAFIFYLPVTVSYTDDTGYTRVTYQYKDDTYYVIESALPVLAVNGDWTKQFT
jgi:hypothetical protein